MSAPPIIRLGGTVGDNFLWDPNQKEAIKPQGNESPNRANTTFILGPKYFDSLKQFPTAKMTFQATLGKPVNFNATIPIIKGAYAAIGADRLAAIAIGNELQIKKEYTTVEGYIKAAVEVENRIIEALNLTGDQRKIFEVLDSLSPDAKSHKPHAA